MKPTPSEFVFYSSSEMGINKISTNCTHVANSIKESSRKKIHGERLFNRLQEAEIDQKERFHQQPNK